jgi:hypothetical protein
VNQLPSSLDTAWKLNSSGANVHADECIHNRIAERGMQDLLTKDVGTSKYGEGSVRVGLFSAAFGHVDDAGVQGLRIYVVGFGRVFEPFEVDRIVVTVIAVLILVRVIATRLEIFQFLVEEAPVEVMDSGVDDVRATDCMVETLNKRKEGTDRQ